MPTDGSGDGSQGAPAEELDAQNVRRESGEGAQGVSADSLAELGGIVGEVLGWSPAQVNEEVKRATSLLSKRHGMKLNQPVRSQ